MEIKVSRKFFHNFVQSKTVEELFEMIDMPVFTLEGEQEELDEIKQNSICPFNEDNNYVSLRAILNGFIIPLTDKVFVTFPEEENGDVLCDIVEKWWDIDENSQ